MPHYTQTFTFFRENRPVYQDATGNKKKKPSDSSEIPSDKIERPQEFKPKEILEYYRELEKQRKPAEHQASLGERIQEIADLTSMRWLESLETIIKSSELNDAEKKEMAEEYLKQHEITRQNLELFQKAKLESWYDVALTLSANEVIQGIQLEAGIETQQKALEELAFLSSEAITNLVKDGSVRINDVTIWENFLKIDLKAVKSINDTERQLLLKCQEIGVYRAKSVQSEKSVSAWLKNEWGNMVIRAIGANALIDINSLKDKTNVVKEKAKSTREKIPTALEKVGDEIVEFAKEHPYITAVLLFLGARLLFGGKRGEADSKLGKLMNFGLKAAGVYGGIVLAGHVLKKLGVSKWLKENLGIDLSVEGIKNQFQSKKEDIEQKIIDKKEQTEVWLEEKENKLEQEKKTVMNTAKDKLKSVLNFTKAGLEHFHFYEPYEKSFEEMYRHLDGITLSDEEYKETKGDEQKVMSKIHDKFLKMVAALKKGKHAGDELFDKVSNIFHKSADYFDLATKNPKKFFEIMDEMITEFLLSLPRRTGQLLLSEAKKSTYNMLESFAKKSEKSGDAQKAAEIRGYISKLENGEQLTMAERLILLAKLCEIGVNVTVIGPITYITDSNGFKRELLGLFGYDEAEIQALGQAIESQHMTDALIRTRFANLVLKVWGKIIYAGAASTEMLSKGILKGIEIKDLPKKDLFHIYEIAKSSKNNVSTRWYAIIDKLPILRSDPNTLRFISALSQSMGPKELSLSIDNFIAHAKKVALKKGGSAGQELQIFLREIETLYPNTLVHSVNQSFQEASVEIQKKRLLQSDLETLRSSKKINPGELESLKKQILSSEENIKNMFQKADAQLENLRQIQTLNREMMEAGTKSKVKKVWAKISDSADLWSTEYRLMNNRQKYLQDAGKIRRILGDIHVNRIPEDVINWQNYEKSLVELEKDITKLRHIRAGKSAEHFFKTAEHLSKGGKNIGKMVGGGFNTWFVLEGAKELAINKDFWKAVDQWSYLVPFYGPARLILPDGQHIDINGNKDQSKTFIGNMIGEYRNPLKRVTAGLGVLALFGDTSALIKALPGGFKGVGHELFLRPLKDSWSFVKESGKLGKTIIVDVPSDLYKGFKKLFIDSGLEIAKENIINLPGAATELGSEISKTQLKILEETFEKMGPDYLSKFKKLSEAEKNIIGNSDELMKIIKSGEKAKVDDLLQKAPTLAKIGPILKGAFIGLDVGFIALQGWELWQKSKLLEYYESQNEHVKAEFTKAGMRNEEMSIYGNAILAAALYKGGISVGVGGPLSIMLGNAKYIADSLNEVSHNWQEGFSEFMKKSDLELYDRWFQSSGIDAKENFTRVFVSGADIIDNKAQSRENVVKALLWKNIPENNSDPNYKSSVSEAQYGLQFIKNNSLDYQIASPLDGKKQLSYARWYAEMMLNRDRYHDALRDMLAIYNISLPEKRLHLNHDELQSLNTDQLNFYQRSLDFLGNKIMSDRELSYLQTVHDELPQNAQELHLAPSTDLLTLTLRYKQIQGSEATQELRNSNEQLLQNLDNTPPIVIKHKLHNVLTILYRQKDELKPKELHQLVEVKNILQKYFVHSFDPDFQNEALSYQFDYENNDQTASKIIEWFENQKAGKEQLLDEDKERGVIPANVETYALYYLAQNVFAYSGKPTLVELQKYFTPEQANYHGLYYQEGKGWYVQLEGLDRDEFISESLKSSSIGKMVKTLRENANNIFEQSGDSSLRMRGNVKDKSFKTYAEIIANTLERGFGYYKEENANFVLK